jgi:hypothetical protein
MKKITRILLLLAVASLFAITNAQAQIVIRARLSAPVTVRPARPSAGHIWVNDEWVVQGGTYVHRDGYWALPPRPGSTWIKGYWQHRRRGGEGYFWVPGHWSGT